MTAFEKPFRLETLADIEEARRANLLGIGKEGFLRMRALAQKQGQPPLPPALELAKKLVKKDFFMMRQEKRGGSDRRFEQAENLPLLEDFPLIAEKLPWVQALALHRDLFSHLRTLAPELRKTLGLEGNRRPTQAYESMLTLRKFFRLEMLSVVRTRRTKALDREEFRKLLTASTLFLPSNEDVLTGIRQSAGMPGREVLFQNCLAELLFSRLPRFMEGLAATQSGMVRRKLFAKLAKLGLSGRQRLSLSGYIPLEVSAKELAGVLGRIESVAGRMSLPEETKKSLVSFVRSLDSQANAVRKVYRELFLGTELSLLQTRYRPRPVMRQGTRSWETIVQTATLQATLEFYPTKDWMDLMKGRFSSDCSGFALGEMQLLCPHFFNVRIFEGLKWIGNIYMLDLTRERGALLVDRIQIPRALRVDFLRFFDSLREVFEEMFAQVPCREILLPLGISNHHSVQTAFHRYRKKLAKRRLRVTIPAGEHFESLAKKTSYCALSGKNRKEG